jgi:hypothetical protein
MGTKCSIKKLEVERKCEVINLKDSEENGNTTLRSDTNLTIPESAEKTRDHITARREQILARARAEELTAQPVRLVPPDFMTIFYTVGKYYAAVLLWSIPVGIAFALLCLLLGMGQHS